MRDLSIPAAAFGFAAPAATADASAAIASTAVSATLATTFAAAFSAITAAPIAAASVTTAGQGGHHLHLARTVVTASSAGSLCIAGSSAGPLPLGDIGSTFAEPPPLLPLGGFAWPGVARGGEAGGAGGGAAAGTAGP